MNFYKMQAIGNDFVLTNEEEIKDYLYDIEGFTKKICDRKFGVGSDGLIYLSKSDLADIKMNYYNADGSRASMCGNGIRCLCKYVLEEKNITNKEIIKVETDDGIKEILIKDELFCVDMGSPVWQTEKIPFKLNKDKILNEKIKVLDREFIFSMARVGVPHIVIVVNEFMSDSDIDKYGAMLECHELFPEKTNVNFVKIENRNKVVIKTFERGAGRTLGCGTGSSAAMAILHELNLVDKEAELINDGGTLIISIEDNKILMQGSAEICFKGSI